MDVKHHCKLDLLEYFCASITKYILQDPVNAVPKVISPNDNFGVFRSEVLFIHKSLIKWQRCAGLWGTCQGDT
jgi:hypothetical protein